ncbi:thioredoxin [Paenibacillus koleovorans]|uniref:thioredoxin n=1 Tax=Paenibacillus koleovorans TaxID=121608 RepID=UPI000FD9468D|nr:thioredoxin [Paenibacillus koleovorans]
MAILNTNDEGFNAAIQDGVVLVDFWAPWCGPCKMIAPILEQLDEKLEGAVTIAKVNVDDNPYTAGKFGIMSIPTLMLFKDGEPVETLVGLRPLAHLEAAVKEHLTTTA